MPTTSRRRTATVAVRPGSSTGARAQKVSVALPAEDAAWARTQAASRHVSVSAVVSEALRRQRQSAALGRLLSTIGAKLSASELNELRAELYAKP
jgi:Arc/MetJ-type ribon-helix-helix transcriptional regulator